MKYVPPPSIRVVTDTCSSSTYNETLSGNGGNFLFSLSVCNASKVEMLSIFIATPPLLPLSGRKPFSVEQLNFIGETAGGHTLSMYHGRIPRMHRRRDKVFQRTKSQSAECRPIRSETPIFSFLDFISTYYRSSKISTLGNLNNKCLEIIVQLIYCLL